MKNGFLQRLSAGSRIMWTWQEAIYYAKQSWVRLPIVSKKAKYDEPSQQEMAEKMADNFIPYGTVCKYFQTINTYKAHL